MDKAHWYQGRITSKLRSKRVTRCQWIWDKDWKGHQCPSYPWSLDGRWWYPATCFWSFLFPLEYFPFGVLSSVFLNHWRLFNSNKIKLSSTILQSSITVKVCKTQVDTLCSDIFQTPRRNCPGKELSTVWMACIRDCVAVLELDATLQSEPWVSSMVSNSYLNWVWALCGPGALERIQPRTLLLDREYCTLTLLDWTWYEWKGKWIE